MSNRSLRAGVALAVLPLIVSARPIGESARWKINTHLYAANIALADALNDGMVTIPPFGEFPVAAAALSALRSNPAAYRAGVLAPDLFPDMYVGGWFIHSDLTLTEHWIADDWLRHAWTRARAWPTASERDKVMAFAYGFVTHGAGDMFAHTWVNEKANGAWVSFWGKDRETAFKHIVLEGYVGEHTPPSDLSLDVWPRFVSTVLIKDPVVRQHSKSAVHYRRWVAMYESLEPLIAKAKSQMNATVGSDAPYWAKCAANPIPCARKEQMETWRLDINRGLRAMVDSSESLGDRLMAGESGDGLSAMTGWAKEWLPKIYGLHAVGESMKAMQELLDWVDEAIPYDEQIKEEVEQFLEQTFPKYWEIYEAAQKPSYWMEKPGLFPPGTKRQVLAEMGTTEGGQLDWRAFEPLYNTVIASKLALLDGNGINELARRAGLAGPIVPAGENTNIMLGVFRSMTQSFQWTGDSIKATTEFGICGYENLQPLERKDQCGLEYRPYRGAAQGGGLGGSATLRGGQGYVLWGNRPAREKIFSVIFKGFGPGPGTPDRTVAEAVPASIAGVREGRRALRAATGSTEYMRELVAVMREKVADAAKPYAARTPAGRVGAARGAAVQSGAPVGNWGQRCCAADIVELRAALAQLRAASAQMTTVGPPTLARLGRRPSTAQMAQRIGLISGAVDAFAAARDASVAVAAMNYIATHVEAITAIAAGTQ